MASLAHFREYVMHIAVFSGFRTFLWFMESDCDNFKHPRVASNPPSEVKKLPQGLRGYFLSCSNHPRGCAMVPFCH
jgi:hypothetical protein